MSKTSKNPSDSSGFPPGDWIPITEAGMILKTRYLKTRDLAAQGFLGKVHRTPNNRYFVLRTEVEKYASAQDS